MFQQATKPGWRERLAGEEGLVPWSRGAVKPGGLELALAFGAFLLVATAVYLPHAFSHGFYTDDWWFLQRFHFTDQGPSSIPDMLDVSPFPGNYHDSFSLWDAYRPGQTTMLLVQYLITGESATAHMALAPPLVAIECLLLYLVLRMLGLRPLVAGAAGLFLAIGTFVDSTRLWVSVQPEMNAASLYLGGLACALQGLRSTVRGRRIAWHGAAILLYLASVFTYEGFLVFLPLSVLAYLLVAGRDAALRRWVPDLLAFGIALATVGRNASSDRDGQLTISHIWDRAGDVIPAAARVFRFSLPAEGFLWSPAGAVFALVVAVGVALAIRRGGPLGTAARQWCAIGLAALALAFIGITPLFAGQTGLTPANVGFGNRLIAASSLLYPLLYLSLAALIAIGIVGLTRRPRFALPLAAVGVTLITAQLVNREIQRQGDFTEAWNAEQEIIGRIQEAIPKPKHESTIISFRNPVVLDGGLVSFGTDYDLDGALKLRYNDRSLRAHAFVPGGRCNRTGITFSGLFEPPNTLPYGQLMYFVDIPRGTVTRVTSRAQCAAGLRRLTSLPIKQIDAL